MPEAPRVRHVIGCMTGTSLDGLDAALVRITGTGLDMRAEHLGLVSVPFDDALRAELRALADGEPRPAVDYLTAARRLGVMHADACEQLLTERAGVGDGSGVKDAGLLAVDFVVAHGQTICHAPRPRKHDADLGPMSWQLFDPWPVVRRLGVPVCCDLRQADLIAGGEGAPITPLADWVLYRESADAVVNLGGVANATWWGAARSTVEAADVYPCNLVLDGLVARLFEGKRFDRDARIAARGVVTPRIDERLTAAIDRACDGAVSLGREQFPAAWFDAVLAGLVREKPADIIATATAVVAHGIIKRLPGGSSLVLAGGGARNPAVANALLDFYVEAEGAALSDDLGIPCEAREAVCFAVLGALSQDGVPITLPWVTGATEPGVAGAWAGI